MTLICCLFIRLRLISMIYLRSPLVWNKKTMMILLCQKVLHKWDFNSHWSTVTNNQLKCSRTTKPTFFANQCSTSSATAASAFSIKTERRHAATKPSSPQRVTSSVRPSQTTQPRRNERRVCWRRVPMWPNQQGDPLHTCKRWLKNMGIRRSQCQPL